MCLRILVTAALAAAAASGTASRAPHFYPDDPIWVDDDRAFDASKVRPVEDRNAYDFLVNTFGKPGERRDVRAMNVNTVDEVPDSSWFTNRIGRREMTIEEIVRGPDQFDRLSLEGWVVSGGKSTGAQPGFRMRDTEGHTYQIEVDPPSNPEMATGAEVIGTAFYYAFGYHVVQVYLAELDRESLVIAPDATIRDPLNGNRRALTRRDLDLVFRRAARLPNGRYRVLASRFADGLPAGNFRYYGTRPDDPNDIVPHEHRRELRGARVFGAWLNHDDSRGINSLDMIEGEEGKRWIRHYMFDFGSILGSGTVHPQVPRAGNEYIFEWRPGWLTLATLGLWVRPWILIDYPEAPPAVGRLESRAFDPVTWKPEYPNPAFQNMRLDDAFWAARIVSRFSDDAIRAIVEKAQFSDPAATEYLTRTIIERRDKVLAAWLPAVNPLVDFTLSPSGELTFRNAAADAGVAPHAESYRVQWGRFDNATGESGPVGDPVTTREMRVAAPAALIQGAQPGSFVEALVSADHPAHPAWATPVTLHFRRTADGWELVGLRRLP
ncbi:MAG TPA: hypothetical protein VF198_02845 [Vicinamibacterales bacterium]